MISNWMIAYLWTFDNSTLRTLTGNPSVIMHAVNVPGRGCKKHDTITRNECSVVVVVARFQAKLILRKISPIWKVLLKLSEWIKCYVVLLEKINTDQLVHLSLSLFLFVRIFQSLSLLYCWVAEFETHCCEVGSSNPDTADVGTMLQTFSP